MTDSENEILDNIFVLRKTWQKKSGKLAGFLPAAGDLCRRALDMTCKMIYTLISSSKA